VSLGIGRDVLACASLQGGDEGLSVIFAAMDESYQGGRIAAVGGYVGTKKKWSKLIDEWMKVVLPTKIRSFHMADCEARKEDFEFYWTPDYLLEIKKRLFQIILNRAKFGVVAAVNLRDYKDLTRGMSKDRAHPYIQDPYFFCLFAAVQAVLRIVPIAIPQFPLDEKVPFIFDENDQFRGRALRYWPYFRSAFRSHSIYKRLGNLVFAEDAFFPPVQAADILVYEGAKRMLHQLTEPDRKWRESLRMLCSKKNVYYTLYERDELAKHIDGMKKDGVF
jgi:hypothetical protein